ncbi:peptidylprolyl isomerase [Campylobacter hominis]
MRKFLISTLSLVAAISLNADVLATAGDIKITDEDITPFLEQNHMNGIDINDEQKKALLENLIKYKLLVKEAKNSGVENELEYKKRLDIAADGIAFGLWQDNEFKKVNVSDDEAKKFYEENNASFVIPEQISASHILVKEEKEAKNIISKLSKLKGEKLSKEFAKIASDKSIDNGTKQNGGALGFFQKGQMVEPFEKAVFGLKKGELTKQPVKTQFGYHIILKTDEKKASTLPFESVKNAIINNIKGQKFQKQIDEKAEALYKAANVQFTDTNATK